jgi:hypothetical protein
MQKIIKVDGKVITLFEDGTYCERENVSDELFKQIVEAECEEDVFALMCPDHDQRMKEYTDVKEFIGDIEDSQLLTLKGESVYWEDVSQLSMPTEFVRAVLDAESKQDKVRIETYRNFWTLMSLNPDERCRKNLFWFLNKNGLVISRCGFFVAYRNADFKCIDEDGVEVYTDAHTHKMSIRIGEIVTMPREDCDTVQENTCSRGLHLGAQWWLQRGYFGNQGLVCLCNPADVVAVPPLDDYGKLRTCAYLPIEKAEFDGGGNVIPFKQHDGFDCGYVTKVIYEGLMGTEEDSSYRIEIPEVPGISPQNISDKLLDIAMKCITDRQV